MRYQRGDVVRVVRIEEGTEPYKGYEDRMRPLVGRLGLAHSHSDDRFGWDTSDDLVSLRYVDPAESDRDEDNWVFRECDLEPARPSDLETQRTLDAIIR